MGMGIVYGFHSTTKRIKLELAHLISFVPAHLPSPPPLVSHLHPSISIYLSPALPEANAALQLERPPLLSPLGRLPASGARIISSSFLPNQPSIYLPSAFPEANAPRTAPFSLSVLPFTHPLAAFSL